MINKFWKLAIHFRAFHRPRPALLETERVGFNYLPNSALTSALQYSIQISLKLFWERAKPTLHSWGEKIPQRPSITLMKCAFHLRLWEKNIKKNQNIIITLKQVPSATTLDQHHGRSKTVDSLVFFFFVCSFVFLSIYEILKFTQMGHSTTNIRKRSCCSATADRILLKPKIKSTTKRCRGTNTHGLWNMKYREIWGCVFTH